jgi:hypothetical protein
MICRFIHTGELKDIKLLGPLSRIALQNRLKDYIAMNRRQVLA